MDWDERLIPFPFRIDAGDDPGLRWLTESLPQFTRLRRVHEMSGHFELARRHLGDAWWCESKGADHVRDYAPLLVQVSQKLSETSDFYRTVDFVSEGVLREMAASRPDLFDPRSLVRAGRCEDIWPRNARGRTHEHMVPIPYLRGLIRGAHHARTGIGRPDLEPGGVFGCETTRTVLLWHLSFRALITAPGRPAAAPAGADRAEPTVDTDAVDGAGRRSGMPESIVRFGPRGERDEIPLRELPLVFHPLARYHASGLAEALVPVNERARRLQAAFRHYLATGEVVLPALRAEGEASGAPQALRDELERFARRLQAEPPRPFPAAGDADRPVAASRRDVAGAATG